MCVDEKTYLLAEWLHLVDSGESFELAAIQCGIPLPKNAKDGGRLGTLRRWAKTCGNQAVLARLDSWRVDRDLGQRQAAANMTGPRRSRGPKGRKR